MSKTNIEWCTHTLNPIVGCEPISIGCQNCYARRMAERLAGQGYSQYQKVKAWDGTVDYLGKEWFQKKVDALPSGARCFVCSMGDLFHENVKPEWIQEIFEIMALRSDVTFLLLTKRTEEAREKIFGSGLDNLWRRSERNIYLGATAENQDLYNKRIPLLDLSAWPHQGFLSCEPLLGLIDLGEWKPVFSWVIVGGETGPGYRISAPYNNRSLTEWFTWARSIRDQCKQANIPFFFKKPPGGGKIGEDGFTLNTPEDLKIRELPA